jgi:hypothetical protein
VAVSILHELSHWKMHKFGLKGVKKLSPKKIFDEESGRFVEEQLFGSRIDFDKGQLYCSIKSKDGVIKNSGFINTKHVYKFFNRDSITSKGREYFWFQKQSLDANASSLRYKEAHVIHPEGHDEKDPTIVY